MPMPAASASMPLPRWSSVRKYLERIMEQKGKDKGCSREQEGEKKKRVGGQQMSIKKIEFMYTGGN
jgi:hypothetical protein